MWVIPLTLVLYAGGVFLTLGQNIVLYKEALYTIQNSKLHECTIIKLTVVGIPCHSHWLGPDLCNYTSFDLAFVDGSSTHDKTYNSSDWSQNPYTGFAVGQIRDCYLTLTPSFDIKLLLWEIPSKSDVAGYKAWIITWATMHGTAIVVLLVYCIVAYCRIPTTTPEEETPILNHQELKTINSST